MLHNTVENATIANGNAYGIGVSGYEHYQEANYNNYVWVDSNTVNEIPTWECYDTHGGEHQWFTNNICYHGRYGIGAGLAVLGAITPVANDFHIVRNTLTSSVYSGTNPNWGNRSCIAVSSDSRVNPVTNVDVEWNTCTGFGASSTGINNYDSGGI